MSVFRDSWTFILSGGLLFSHLQSFGSLLTSNALGFDAHKSCVSCQEDALKKKSEKRVVEVAIEVTTNDV